MEKNNLNKAYIYIIAIFAIGIAISNIVSFFNGVGFALIGSSVLLVLTISTILKDEDNKKRFGDIFVLIALEFLMFIVLFFAYDFNLNGITNKFPLVMRNICAIYSLLSAGYVIFRYISEIKGKRYNFVEYMLGNYTPQPKEKKLKPSKAEIKKNKELENGTLAPKPSSLESFEENKQSTENSREETVEEEKVEEDNNIEEDSKVDNNQNETTQESTSNVNNRTNFWY